MLRLLRHLLYRFRWPVLTALLTVPLLAFLFQPRPVAEYCVPVDPTVPFGYREQFLISPSGAYLVLFSFDKSVLHLYQMNTMKLLFKQACIDESTCGFDDTDGLAFASYGSGNGKPNDSIVEWWHWHPGQPEPQKLGSRKAFPAGIRRGSWFNDEFNGLTTFGDRNTINGILSPDARTWLFLNQNEATFHFDLIDARNGEVKARLERPDINRGISETTSVEVMFSLDSKQLLAQ